MKKFRNSGDIKLWYYAHDTWYILCADRELAGYLESHYKFDPLSFVFLKDDCIGWVYKITALQAKQISKELQLHKYYKGPLPGRELYTKFFSQTAEERKPEKKVTKKLTAKQEHEEKKRIARLQMSVNKDELNRIRREKRKNKKEGK